jgi:hypothetical protein
MFFGSGCRSGRLPIRSRALQSARKTDSTSCLAVSLSPEAHHRALELTRTSPLIAEYWPTFDPSAVIGSREQILDAYRDVRDGLYGRIRQRFGPLGARGV